MIPLLEIAGAVIGVSVLVFTGIVAAALFKVSATPVPAPDYNPATVTWMRAAAKVAQRRSA